jgi:adenylate cyclase
VTATRKLAAILAADMAGYSRLIGIDEEGTIARLQALRRELIDPVIANHHGRIVKTTGDGMLVEFASVVDAVRCAVEVQREMAERNGGIDADRRIEFRIGINVGDVVVDGDDLLGDGVNVAARLEGVAEPGGVCISEDAYRQVRDRMLSKFVDSGEQHLKNIARPVRVYRLTADDAPSSPTSRATLSLPDKPSIAVLPFQNMSGDPEQEYFADGIVEDIITALSRFRQLFVIARNSTFTYKGRAVDVKRVGRELGVRYVLEGSVRKAAAKVRITAQLIDATTGAHLWADHFDGPLEDIFDLQDQVTTSVVGVIAPKLEQAEIERARRKPTDSLDAYDHYLRGMAVLNLNLDTMAANSEAQRHFAKSIELDPEFASAYGASAYCYVLRNRNGWMVDREREVAEIKRLARRAGELGKDDAVALAYAGMALAYAGGEVEEGAAMLERAHALNPNLARAWEQSAWVQVFLGNGGMAIERATRSMQLNPLDPYIYSQITTIAFGHFCAGRYDEAAAWGERALRERPEYRPALRVTAASRALTGRSEDAQRVMAHVRQLDPHLRVSGIKDLVPFRRAEDRTCYEEGLRKAGLPE